MAIHPTAIISPRADIAADVEIGPFVVIQGKVGGDVIVGGGQVTLGGSGVAGDVVIGGGNIFRGLAASARGMERASADYMGVFGNKDNITPNLDRLAQIAAKRGLRAVLHPHVGTMVETRAEVDRVLAGSRIPLCLDTGHISYCGGDNIAIIERAPERIGYLHLKQVDPEVRAKVEETEDTVTKTVTEKTSTEKTQSTTSTAPAEESKMAAKKKATKKAATKSAPRPAYQTRDLQAAK